MYTAPFRYLRPKTLAEAQALFRDSSDGRYIAGGQTLIPTMKQRLAAPTELIDIGRIASLAFIRREGASLVVGAGTPHADVAASDDVRSAIPALASLAGQIGDPAVRHKGALGGSIANNDPAADYPAGVLGLGATITTTDRTIAADEIFTGMFETVLEPGESVTEVDFPQPPGWARHAEWRSPTSPAPGVRPLVRPEARWPCGTTALSPARYRGDASKVRSSPKLRRRSAMARRAI